mgnify:CR=1 FL=1
MNAPAKSLLDIDAFPLVQVREMPRELADVERWLEEVEALLAVERSRCRSPSCDLSACSALMRRYCAIMGV